MLKKLALGLTLLSFTSTLLAADAFTGTWKLNVAKSKLAAGTEVKELTVVVAEQGDNLAVTVKGTAGDQEGECLHDRQYEFPEWKGSRQLPLSRRR